FSIVLMEYYLLPFFSFALSSNYYSGYSNVGPRLTTSNGSPHRSAQRAFPFRSPYFLPSPCSLAVRHLQAADNILLPSYLPYASYFSLNLPPERLPLQVQQLVIHR